MTASIALASTPSGSYSVNPSTPTEKTIRLSPRTWQKKKRPNSIARSSQTRQTCGVAVDGERTGRERRAALVECCSERRPERGRVGGRERVVLVENDAAEPGAAELSPVETPDVLHRHVRQRQARLGRRDGRHRGHTGWVEPLPQGAPPPRCRAHGGRSVR